MTRSKLAIIAFAITLPLLAAAGCATQEEMSALRTEVTTSQEMARAAQSEAAVAAEEAARAARAAENAAAKAERIYQESLRK